LTFEKSGVTRTETGSKIAPQLPPYENRYNISPLRMDRFVWNSAV